MTRAVRVAGACALLISITACAAFIGLDDYRECGTACDGDGSVSTGSDGASDGAPPGDDGALGDARRASGKPGMICSGQACTKCCADASSQTLECSPNSTSVECVPIFRCDDPVDCEGQGGTCCLVNNSGSTCMTASSCASASGTVVCAVAEDCPRGVTCQPRAVFGLSICLN